MKFEILHRTRYTYQEPVRESFNEVRLQPLSDNRQSLDSFLLKILPSTQLRHYHDFYSNCVHHFEINEPHASLAIESQLKVTTKPVDSLPLDARPAPMESLKAAVEAGRCYDFIPASAFVDVSPETWRLAIDASQGETDVWQTALRLMQFVNDHIKYQSKSTTVHTHMREVLAQRTGVCQDFAHVMLGMSRSLGLPALYVSGYLATEVASATHAWVEVFIPSVGWHGLDPTHNRLIDETYVKLAVGRDYADVAPVRGTYKGTTQRTLNVEVRVEQRD